MANDMSATHVFTGSTREIEVTDNGDGTLTILVQGTINSKFFFPQGFRFHDRGMFRDELLIDTKGTPDPSDDEAKLLREVKSPVSQTPPTATSAPTCSSSSANRDRACLRRG